MKYSNITVIYFNRAVINITYNIILKHTPHYSLLPLPLLMISPKKVISLLNKRSRSCNVSSKVKLILYVYTVIMLMSSVIVIKVLRYCTSLHTSLSIKDNLLSHSVLLEVILLSKRFIKMHRIKYLLLGMSDMIHIVNMVVISHWSL